MILNILVCAFLFGMVILWSTYGLFPAFLNLLVTLASGLLAFALWEPVAHLMLGFGWNSAWGMGLLVPYLIAFVALRLGVLALVKKNLGFHPVVDQAGGGAVGLCAGVLTAGVLVIGAGMMANDKTLLNVQRYQISEDGSVVEDKKSGVKLWIPVDRLAGGVYESLSAGAFHPSGDGWTLAAARPKLSEVAEKYRLAADPMATRVAIPGAGVQVVGGYQMECSPDALESLMHHASAYAIMKRDMVEEVWKGEGRRQIDSRLADLIAATLEKGEDPKKVLFDDKYLGTPERKGVRGLLGSSVGEQPEIILRRMWEYLDDQVPGGAASKAAFPAQTKLFEKFPAGQTLVVIDTAWDKEKSGAYDDGILRLSSHQVQLIADKTPSGKRYQPVAWSTPMLATPAGFARRELIELTGGKVGMYGVLGQPGTPDRLAFVFVVPKGCEPAAIELRGLRFPLGKLKVAAPGAPGEADLAQVIGHILPPGNPEEPPVDKAATPENQQPPVAVSDIKAPLGIVEFTNRTPIIIDWTSPPEQHSKYEVGKRDTVLISGEFEKGTSQGLHGTIYKITRIKADPGTRCIRLKLNLDQCHTLWGAMLDSSERGGQELMMRTDGRQIGAAGFIVTRTGGMCLVRIDPNGRFKVTGKVLSDLRPTLGAEDAVYAYYFVDESESLVGYGLYNPETKALNAAQQYDFSKPIPMKQVPAPL